MANLCYIPSINLYIWDNASEIAILCKTNGYLFLFFRSAISPPSIFTFGIMLLKLPSCAKLMVIYFYFSELMFVSFGSVHLAAISTDSCITDTPFLSHILNNIIEQSFLNHLCKQGNIYVQTMFLAVLTYWDDQNGNIHFLLLLVELRLIEILSPILKYVRATHTTVAYLVTNDD